MALAEEILGTTKAAGRNTPTEAESKKVLGKVAEAYGFDGASIMAKYQAQFTRILREGSFSDLMEYLKQKAVSD